ncbi:MAG: hypothetical protein A3H28_12120 [Acidobacteria bacterium RIFCSPLOWO2_02_FULL_61_28]|nr:MAG: hypothetical protein A3H28_12120 [Acidobacteria bacterium RIFCSPLOWO2_02_FULL_61_28]
MKHWKLIGAGAGIAAAAALSFAFLGRRDATVSADNAGTSAPQDKSFLSRLSRQPELITVPANTKLPIRLEHAISTEKNSPGDSFTGSLDGPLMVDGKLVAPSHSKVVGQITQVKESGRVEGRASLTMVVQKLVVDGREYDLNTVPITRIARSTKKKDAAIIGGGAAAGAVIGAIAGGGKGAAIGAGVGGGSGTGYVLATKGAPVAYGPEARFVFVLSNPVELPVYKQSS